MDVVVRELSSAPACSRCSLARRRTALLWLHAGPGLHPHAAEYRHAGMAAAHACNAAYPA